ncbi:hypothetical protein GEV33_004056 [Tenebrio molitor]|uniref:Uncharacterized protein n=1 Tax=Tenebrio molitor TaxID=7067 RepID=A0A8J6LER6_TENMO|nr:hypothetical protein GEV33_004056 [Tenebrio molitor]
MREGSRTFQNGLSDPDFRCQPRQICERRGEDIKVEQTPCAGEPVEEDRSGLEIVQEELQPYVAADIGFLHEGHRPYASADHFRHPVGPASSPRIPPENRTSLRTVPGRGTRVQEQLLSSKFHVIRPEVTSPETMRQLALGGEEGPRGLSEDTDGVIDHRRKRDSEDLPPAHSSRDSHWIPSLRPGEDVLRLSSQKKRENSKSVIRSKMRHLVKCKLLVLSPLFSTATLFDTLAGTNMLEELHKV